MKKCRIIIAVIMSLSLLLLWGCSSKTEKTTEDNGNKVVSGKVSVEYTDKDLDGTWESSDATKVQLESTYTISNPGTYVFSGTLKDGQIIVAAGEQDKVKIVLNNANIHCNDGPAIQVNSGDKVFITLAEGSSNTISDGTTYSSSEDQSWGAIFSIADLTINGTGKLTVDGNYNNGIVTKDDLRITGGTISVTAKANGIKGRDSVGIYDGNITVSAGNDGIKADNNEKEGKGFVSINGGEVTIKDVESQGITAATVAQITDGKVNIESNFEGIEGEIVYIKGGEIDVQAADDGLNATAEATANSSQNQVCIEIEGGVLNVLSEADGLDSNGDILISGGQVTIQGAESGGNGAIDYEGKGTITGGTLIAFGSAQMAQNFGDDTTQCTFMYNGTEVAAGTDVVLSNEKGEQLTRVQSKIRFSSIIISTAELKKGEKYTLKIGDTSETIQMDSVITSLGSANTMNGGRMGGGKPPELPN